MQLVLLAGYSSCGKGTALEIFREHEYNCLDVSDDILKPKAKEMGIVDIRWLGITSKMLGYTFYTKRIKEMMGESPYACVSGIRDIEIYRELKCDYSDLHLLWLESDLEKRFSRYTARKRPGDTMATINEFIQHEERDKELFRTEELKKKADLVIENNESKEVFISKICEIAKYQK